MNVERLIGSVIEGALGGRRKRSRGAMRYLTGGKRSFLNGSTLLALAGVAWGVWETANRPPSDTSPGGPAPTPPPPPPAPPQGRAARSDAAMGPPPIPQAPGAAVPPPLPGTMPSPATEANVPPEVLRVLRLTLSAARADGTLTPREREAILAQARLAGAEPLVAAELQAPRPLAEIAGGVSNPMVREDLYTLAFSIVRADEAVSPGERSYLTELAGHLRLEPEVVARLEEQAAGRIQAAAEGAER